MHQRMAEKAGKSLHPTNNATSKSSDAMEVDATCQQQSGKEVRNQKTYLAFMKGKCYGCGSTDHTKANGNHERDICNHCRKWVTAPQFAKVNTWENLLLLKQLPQSRNNQLHLHRRPKGRHWRPLQCPRRPKIVRDKQTYWPS